MLLLWPAGAAPSFVTPTAPAPGSALSGDVEMGNVNPLHKKLWDSPQWEGGRGGVGAGVGWGFPSHCFAFVGHFVSLSFWFSSLRFLFSKFQERFWFSNFSTIRMFSHLLVCWLCLYFKKTKWFFKFDFAWNAFFPLSFLPRQCYHHLFYRYAILLHE